MAWAGMSRRYRGRDHIWKEVAVVAAIDRLRLHGWMLNVLVNVIRGVPGVLVSERNNFEF